MENKREIKKKYEKLIHDVKTSDYYLKIDLTNRVNCYQCKCGHITKTKDVDPGVTPFMFRCEKCNDLATSNFYKDIAPWQNPTIEWYRPTLEECLKNKNKPAFLDHVFNGGLNDRKIPCQ